MITTEQAESLLGQCVFCEEGFMATDFSVSSSRGDDLEAEVKGFCRKCHMERSIRVPRLSRDMLHNLQEGRPALQRRREPSPADRVLIADPGLDD